MERAYNLPYAMSFPFTCSDPSCGCRVPNPFPEGATVGFEEDGEVFLATIKDGDGGVVDFLRDRNLASLVEAVHRNYPHARKE